MGQLPEELSAYERRRWEEIEAWKEKVATPGKQYLPEGVRTKVDDVARKANDAWHAVPGNDKVERWIAEAINGSFMMTVDAVSATINEAKIVQKVGKGAGRQISTYEEFSQLDLRCLDDAAPSLKILRSVVAAGHGAASGFVAGGATAAGAATGGMGALPAAGIVAGLAVADAATLVGSMVQGTALVGAHYGFDPKSPQENAMLLSMLGAGLAREGAKVAAMMKVRELALALAAKQTIAQLSQKQLFALMRRVYAVLLLKTAKRNIAKGVPVLGAGIGAAVNYRSVRTVLEAAQYLYPERFLEVKYPSVDVPGRESSIIDLRTMLDDDESDDDKGILDHLEELELRGEDELSDEDQA